MSYQVIDTTVGLRQAMQLIKPAMKGMPDKHQYLARYRSLCRQVARLVMLVEDGEIHFSEDAAVARKQKTAAAASRTAKSAVKSAV